MEFRFGVDLITFYHPSFWGVDDREAFEKVALEDPRRFWDRIVESVTAAGITGVEVTFPPGNWETAVADLWIGISVHQSSFRIRVSR